MLKSKYTDLYKEIVEKDVKAIEEKQKTVIVEDKQVNENIISESNSIESSIEKLEIDIKEFNSKVSNSIYDSDIDDSALQEVMRLLNKAIAIMKQSYLS